MKKSISCVLLIIFLMVTSFVMVPASAEVISYIDSETIPTDSTGNAAVLTSIKVSQDSVVLESNGYSAFIDVIASFSDGVEIDVTADAEMTTSDINIAFAEFGRILALGKGKAVVTVKYGNLETEINVQVQKKVDLIADVKKNQKGIDCLNPTSSSNSGIGIMSMTPTERARINSLCLQMISFYWTPTLNLTGYKNYWTYYANTTYQGIPYSWTPNQCNKVQFQDALDNSDFYSPYYIGSNPMPRYGNDCSGFTSRAWEITRINSATFLQRVQNGTYPIVGFYNPISPTYNDLMLSYSALQTGDAVVHSGHVFVIAVNYTGQSKLQCFEQAGPLSTITYWYYNDLALGYYLPFSKI